MNLTAQSLIKTYRAGTAAELVALRDVSLDFPAGSLTLLKGPSGSGKTTLLALLGALDWPTNGKVLLDDCDLAACSDAERARLRRRMGFIFQDFALMAGLPAWENASYHLIPRGVNRAERKRLAVEMLERLGLAERVNARPRELSGGEQQRLALARALIGAPEVIIADEPTSNLDDALAETVIALLSEAHDGGASVIVASHDPRFAPRVTKTVDLAAGRMV
jgi:putative ABC transport system ATP-binding protein